MSIRFRLWLGGMACAALLLAGLNTVLLSLSPLTPPGAVLTASALVLAVFAPVAWLLSGLAYGPVRGVTRSIRRIVTGGELDSRCFYRGPRDDVGKLVVEVNDLLVRYEAVLGGLQRLRAAPPGCTCPREGSDPDPMDLVLGLPSEHADASRPGS